MLQTQLPWNWRYDLVLRTAIDNNLLSLLYLMSHNGYVNILLVFVRFVATIQ